MTKSLEEVNQSVSTLNKKSVFRKILAFFWSGLFNQCWLYGSGKLGDGHCGR